MRIISLPRGREIYPDYCVTLNGEAAPAYAVTVSAIPYNRRWPGHQRQKEQTEQAAFTEVMSDGPVSVCVRVGRDFERALVRPLSKKVAVAREGNALRFTLPAPGGYSLELDGSAHALHLFVKPEQGPEATGRVYRFGPGEHEIGTLEMKSHETLYLEAGCVLRGYIKATDAEDVRILGPGMIDGSRNRETILFEATGDGDEDCGNSVREHSITLERCRHVVLDGFTMVDSLCYNVAAFDCQDMEISHLYLVGNWRFNSDGIDLHNCRRCHIADCFTRCYDDCICVKGHLNRDSISEDILVERCVVWNDWGRALEFGAETCADEIRNITWRDCDVIHCVHVMLDVQSVDYAEIHDVLFEDIRCEYEETAPAPAIQRTDDQPYDPGDGSYLCTLMCAVILHHHEYSQTDRTGITHDVTFRDIAVTAPKMPPSFFNGFDAEHPVYDIRIEGLTLNGQRVTDTEKARLVCGEFSHDISLQ